MAIHVDDEDKKLNDKSSSSFGQRGATLINESGLYSLILSSKLPTAKEFKRWVTAEVLPTIHKTGTYNTPNKQSKTLEIKETNARVRLSNQFLKLAKVDTLSEEFRLLNFEETNYIDEHNRKQPMYYLTRDGFTFSIEIKKQSPI